MGSPCLEFQARQGKPPDTDLLFHGSCLLPISMASDKCYMTLATVFPIISGFGGRTLTCWLMRRIAISGRSVNSWKAASITVVGVSVRVVTRRARQPFGGRDIQSVEPKNFKNVLASTIRKFFFCCGLMCPIPANSNPVIESCAR